MPRPVTPSVFLIAETSIVDSGLDGYMKHIKSDWRSERPTSDAEELIEVAGRTCYASFGNSYNKNITKTRDGNSEYLKNILKQGHGSVTEHATVSFAFCDISTVCAQELIRHRVGTAISAESGRYVRREALSYYPGDVAIEIVGEEFRAAIDAKMKADEEFMNEMAKKLNIAGQSSFHIKKKLTSWLRRMEPKGATGNMVWSANIRALRHIISMRTSPSAEEEIRLLFSKVADIVVPRYPAVFVDFMSTPHDGIMHWCPSEIF